MVSESQEIRFSAWMLIKGGTKRLQRILKDSHL